MLSLMSSEDNDVRARAARLMEEDNECTFPEIMDDLEHFEQLKKDLSTRSKSKYEINQVHKRPSQNHQKRSDQEAPSTSYQDAPV